MPYARRFAACLNLTTAGVLLAGGLSFMHEADATAAARRAPKQVRRTASAPSSGSVPNHAAPSTGVASDPAAPAQPGNGATGAAPNSGVPAVDQRPKDALSGRRNRDASVRARSPRLENLPSNGPANDPSRESAPGKSPAPPTATTKTLAAETARAPEGSSSQPMRAANDVRPSAAKTPAPALPNLKSTAEKFGAEPAADGATVARSVVVNVEGPIFDGGDVPRAAAALDRMKSSFARCAAGETALMKSEGSVDVKFLVRAPGRAEGVDVDKARGVSGDVVRCMTAVLARSYVGVPSDDPVGVAITLRVRKD
jgi:hypothetical protein